MKGVGREGGERREEGGAFGDRTTDGGWLLTGMSCHILLMDPAIAH